MDASLTLTPTALGRPGWRAQLRALLAIARKDLLHYSRYPLNAAFRVVEPLVWLTPLYFMGRSFANPAGVPSGFVAYTGTPNYMAFILIGAALSNYVAAVFWGMGFGLKQEMDSGVLESNWLTPVPRPLFLLGQTLASLALTSVQVTAMMALAQLVFGFRLEGSLLAAVAMVLPMLVALYGFGFAFAALVLLLKDANTLVDVSNFLVTQFSGAQFPVRALPQLLLPISLALPLTYGYDALRGILLGAETLLPLELEFAILVGSMVVLVLMGWAVFGLVERRCRRLGSLATH
jgi:ABC-2 type transport system permease protein